jgi:hypothetical protein
MTNIRSIKKNKFELIVVLSQEQTNKYYFNYDFFSYYSDDYVSSCSVDCYIGS